MRRLRVAMVGGGPGSFIGPVHRMAAELDGRIRLVAGVFSRDPAKSAQAAAAWGVAPDRVYPDHHTMFAAERARAAGSASPVDRPRREPLAVRAWPVPHPPHRYRKSRAAPAGSSGNPVAA